MPVVWLNGTVGSGKSAVGAALAGLLPASRFVDGDDVAGPDHLPDRMRWNMALDALLAAVRRRGRFPWLVVAYPLDAAGFCRLRAACATAGRHLDVVNLDVPLSMTLRGRGGRMLSTAEKRRVRVMGSEGYHRRPFAAVSLQNAHTPVGLAARRVLALMRPVLEAKSSAQERQESRPRPVHRGRG